MRKQFAFYAAAALVIGLLGISNAALHDHGGGLIYDDVLNITWLQDANYALTSGYWESLSNTNPSFPGAMNWHDAMDWADQLEYASFTNWRLPDAHNQDGSGPDMGFDVTGSELGHLYYNNLGGTAHGPFPGPGFPVSFQNLQSSYYWSGTYHPFPDYAWANHMGEGNQNFYLPDNWFYAWAVRDGDVIPHIHCVTDAIELQAALDIAATNNTDDIIRIVQGTYLGNFVYDSTESNSLTIEGGFEEGCTARMVDPAKTVLDAQNSGRVLTFNCINVDADLILDGITIRNGDVTTGNGGGLFINSFGNVTLINDVFANNTTEDNGGAAYMQGEGAIFTLANSIICNNSAENDGNENGGGLYIQYAAKVTISNNSIHDNISQLQGGGVYLARPEEVEFKNNNIYNNSSGHYGGGVYVINATSMHFFDNVIINNTANGRYGSGGGVYIHDGDIAILNNNIISGNTGGEDGGGLNTTAARATLTNNTISFNQTAGDGGGVFVGLDYDIDFAEVFNNIIWSNNASLGEDVYLQNDRNHNSIASTIDLYHNNFDQSPAGTYIQIPFSIDPNNLDNEDPLFVDPTIDDYHLGPGSPCIDAGDPSATGLPSEDFEGDDRVIGLAPDIGADEAVYSPIDLMNAILAYFDACVEDGTLWGVGRIPWLAQLRLSVMRWMLETAAERIEQGENVKACRILKRCCLRCDDEPKPNDFVEGQRRKSCWE